MKNIDPFSVLPRAGDVVAGKYRVEEPLGHGGMGVVFAAHHLLLDQRVVLKLALPELAEHPEFVARFLNEARAAARLESDHAVGVMDVGTLDDGLPFMVMEYLDGEDLAKVLRARGRLSVTDTIDWILQALCAIAEAHARGIVHRDLKPSNLFLARRSDGSLRVKVLDFGISKFATTPGATPSDLTSSRSSLGSPSYMSPEQLRSARDVDQRSDIWAVGIVLYELLTGRVPFHGDSGTALVAAILEQHPAAVTSVRADIPFALERAIHKCLAKDRAARFLSVADVALAIAPFGSAACAASVERITGVLGVRPRPPQTSAPSFATAPTEPLHGIATAARTTSAWTGAEPHAKASSRVTVWVALAGVALVGGTIATVLFSTSRGTSPSSGVPSSTIAAALASPQAEPRPSAVSSEAPALPTASQAASNAAGAVMVIDALPLASASVAPPSARDRAIGRPGAPTVKPSTSAAPPAIATTTAAPTATATGIPPALRNRD